jgi:hypothetical protein
MNNQIESKIEFDINSGKVMSLIMTGVMIALGLGYLSNVFVWLILTISELSGFSEILVFKVGIVSAIIYQVLIIAGIVFLLALSLKRILKLDIFSLSKFEARHFLVVFIVFIFLFILKSLVNIELSDLLEGNLPYSPNTDNIEFGNFITRMELMNSIVYSAKCVLFAALMISIYVNQRRQ